MKRTITGKVIFHPWRRAVLVLFLVASVSNASSSGISGYTGKTSSCVTCHSQDPELADRAPNVIISIIESPSQLVAGTALGIEVKTRRAPNSSNRWVGFNAEVFYAPVGSLAIHGVGEHVQSFENAGVREVGHEQKKDFLLGALQENGQTFYEVSWTFHVEIPSHYPVAETTDLTVYASVNNVNGAGAGGDYVTSESMEFSFSGLAIECGQNGAPEAVCDADTFDETLHPFEQNIPCCCPDADNDDFMAAFCNPTAEERGGDCQDNGLWAERRHPQADESSFTYRCDLLDNDCNGIVDDQFYPDLGPACETSTDCPVGYYCNQARSGVAARCALPCDEDDNGNENSTFYCADGLLRCLDTTAVEYCNGIDDDQDGLIDEDYVNGVPALGSECDIDFSNTGIVLCDPSGIGMVCGVPPILDSGVLDSGTGSDHPLDGGRLLFSDGGFLTLSDASIAPGVFVDAGTAPMGFDAGDTVTSQDDDAGFIVEVMDASLNVTTAIDAGTQPLSPPVLDSDSEDGTVQPVVQEKSCGCQTAAREGTMPFLCAFLLVSVYFLRRKPSIS